MAETQATQFAPAQRASDEELRADVRLFALPGPLPRLIADTAPLAVVVLNRFRQIVYANRRMREMTGRSSEELIGLRPGEALSCEHADLMPGGCGTSVFCANCGAVRAILSSLGGREDIQECRMSLPGGGALDLRVWTAPFEVEGRQFGLFMAQDISNEKRREALERAFFHDVLNTAGAALGWATLEDHRPDVERLGRARVPHLIRRLIEEIHSHRDLAEMELGRYEVSPGPVRGVELLRELAGEWTEHDCARDKRIDVLELEEVELCTDGTLLRRVLSNMIKNALEASAPGDRITLGCETAEGRARFTVNNPAVMTRDVQLQLFKRSFSTKGPGRGLGTYSMRLLSERYLGGTITFSSVEGEGTTFIASYPLEPGRAGR
jgi:signal transduction histidine kinase